MQWQQCILFCKASNGHGSTRGCHCLCVGLLSRSWHDALLGPEVSLKAEDLQAQCKLIRQDTNRAEARALSASSSQCYVHKQDACVELVVRPSDQPRCNICCVGCRQAHQHCLQHPQKLWSSWWPWALTKRQQQLLYNRATMTFRQH